MIARLWDRISHRPASIILVLIIGGGILFAIFSNLPSAKTAPQPAARPQNSTPDAAQTLEFEPAAPPEPRDYRLRVEHKHRFGSCDGVLIFTDKRVRYVTHSEDAFDLARDELQQDEDGFSDRSGRSWHFSSPYADVREVVHKWLGERPLTQTTAAEPSSELAPAEAQDAQPARALKVTHKHRFGSCDGLLKLSPAGISFEAVDGKDSFTFAIDQVELDGDGVKDPTGKGWHFKADDVNVAEILRAWKSPH